jgi:hypothetical protein
MAKERRRCSAKTKRGTDCRAWALEGKDTCLAHSDSKTRESAGFIARNGKQGRPHLPTPTEIARNLIEENVAVVLEPHFRTLGYTIAVEDGELHLYEREEGPAKICGESRDGDIVMSPYDNLGAMIAAAEKLLDRIYGRPKSVSESKLEVTSRSQMDREIERLTEQLEHRSNGNQPARS